MTHYAVPTPSPLTQLVESLPTSTPFIAPDELERQRGAPFQLRLGANESAFGVSSKTQSVLRNAGRYASWYGDPLSFELREQLALEHGLSIENIRVAAGIDELFSILVRICIDTSTTAVTSAGTYPTFAYFVTGAGGNLVAVPYDNGHINGLSLVEGAKNHHARLCYLANPDNPTGTLLAPDALQKMLAHIPKGCLLVLDEAYADFVPAKELLAWDAEDVRLVRLRTFSKAHGLAGVRIGYAVGPAWLMQAFDKVRVQFGVNRIAQAAALASLSDHEFLKKVNDEVASGRAEYVHLAQELGLTTLPSFTNFVAFDFGNAKRANVVFSHLAERGCFVRKPTVPPLDRYIRVTVGAHAERIAFASLLTQIIRVGS